MKNIDEQMIVQLTVQQLKQIMYEVMTTSSANTLPKFESTITDRGTKIIGLRDLAKHIGCGLNTAQKLKDDGKIPYSQIGNRFYFYSNDVDVALQTHK
jgi:predicted methyltransferase